jgi:hypothetical protein
LHDQVQELFRKHLDAERGETERLLLGLAERCKQQAEQLSLNAERKAILDQRYRTITVPRPAKPATLASFDQEMERRQGL